MTSTPNLTVGDTYAVTYEPAPDPRRAPRYKTRKLRLAETFETGGRTYYRFEPLRSGYRVTLGSHEFTAEVAR